MTFKVLSCGNDFQISFNIYKLKNFVSELIQFLYTFDSKFFFINITLKISENLYYHKVRTKRIIYWPTLKIVFLTQESKLDLTIKCFEIDQLVSLSIEFYLF